MNVSGPVRSRPVPLSAVNKRGLVGGNAAGGAASDVDMYSDVPSFELSLDEFEEYALARLKVRIFLCSCNWRLLMQTMVFDLAGRGCSAR